MKLLHDAIRECAFTVACTLALWLIVGAPDPAPQLPEPRMTRFIATLLAAFHDGGRAPNLPAALPPGAEIDLPDATWCPAGAGGADVPMPRTYDQLQLQLQALAADASAAPVITIPGR